MSNNHFLHLFLAIFCNFASADNISQQLTLIAQAVKRHLATFYDIEIFKNIAISALLLILQIFVLQFVSADADAAKTGCQQMLMGQPVN